MKQILSSFLCLILLSCNNDNNGSAATSTAADSAATSSTVDLPFTASYTTNFTTGVSDADLKTVMTSYKDWADGNMTGVAKAYTDTMEWDSPTGDHLKLPKAAMIKVWTDYRDSLKSVVIDMQAWHKMYAADKKMTWIAAWYKETDTYKSGKADSGSYHDLSLLIDGKITYLEQYKRPAK